MARQAVAILDAQPQAPRNVATSCPADFAAYDLIRLRYPRHQPLTIVANATGCPVFSNGVFRSGWFSPANAEWISFRDALIPTRLPGI
jgi:hypothetical protein